MGAHDMQICAIRKPAIEPPTMHREKLPLLFWAMIAAVSAFWLTAAFVAAHFIAKFW
jgi:hypothetical protein